MELSFSPIIPMEKIKGLSAPGTTGGGAENSSATSFQTVLGDYLREADRLMQTAEQDEARLVLGQADDLAQIQINALKAEAALQTAVQITSRAVNAYKEIMQMQV